MCLLAGMCARARVCVCVCVLVCPCETCLYTCNFVCAGGCMPISLFVCLLVCFRAFDWMRVYDLACPMRRACIPISLFMCPPQPRRTHKQTYRYTSTPHGASKIIHSHPIERTKTNK